MRLVVVRLPAAMADRGGRVLTTGKRKRKHRAPWRIVAERHNVSTKTLDRWVARGIFPAPERIRERKYGDLNAEPRIDPPRQIRKRKFGAQIAEPNLDA